MAIEVRENEGPLEPVTWPTGEEVVVRRPNIYAHRFWIKVAEPAMEKEDQEAALDALVEFTNMICPSKSKEQIMEECDVEFLMLVCGYSRGALKAAKEFVAGVMGKSPAGTDPASPPPTMSGTSPVESLVLTAVPCGT
jgi:hypothetical protein